MPYPHPAPPMDESQKHNTGPAPARRHARTAEGPDAPPARSRMGLAHPRVRLTALLFASAMLLFSMQRLAVLLVMRQRFEGYGLNELLRALAVGLRFDAVIACMLTVPMLVFVLPAPPRLLDARWYQKFLAGYAAAVLSLSLLTCIGDYFFFQEFGQRLNAQAIQYLGYGYVYQIVWDQYPVLWAMLAVIGVFLAIRFSFLRLGFAARCIDTPLWQSAVWLTALIGLVVLGIRGGVGPKPINTGPAYFAGPGALAQLSLNGLFTVREAWADLVLSSHDLSRYHELLPEREAWDLTRQMLAAPGDQFTGDTDNPLRRVTDTGRPQRDYNVVLVVLESMHWAYVGAMGGDPALMPNLSALAERGVLMDHCFAVGTRTTRGFAGIVAGFPDLPGDSITTRAQAEGHFMTLGTVLTGRGYDTMFIYGGQPYYDHRQAFLGSNGYQRFVFEDQFASRSFRTHLGWCDQDLFDTALATFDAAHRAGRPFFATLLTLTFHRPYEIPAGKIEPSPPGTEHADQIDAIRYTDRAIGEFMDRARQADYFDDTIFVFVADHKGGFKEHPNDARNFRVPLLIYAPGVLGPEGRRVSTVCSQTDIAPTIVGLLGGTYQHTFLGSDVLSRPAERGFALMQQVDGEYHFMDADGAVLSVPPFGAKKKLARLSMPDTLTPIAGDAPGADELGRDLRRRGVAMLQSADMLFNRGGYQPQPQATTPLVLGDGAGPAGGQTGGGAVGPH